MRKQMRKAEATKPSLRQFRGVYAAMLTPYDSGGRVNPAAISRLVAHFIRHGIRGVYVCGSTGEWPLLSEEERRLVTETSVAEARGRLKVIVHVGDHATGRAVRLARHAAACGADAVSAVPPMYYKWTGPAVRRHYAQIAKATPLPLLMYSLEGIAGLDFSVETLKPLFDLPNVAGMKYTGKDFYQFRLVRDYFGKSRLLFSGADEMMLDGLAAGSDGAIGTFQNLMPGRFVRLYQLFLRGNWRAAAAEQREINRVIAAVIRRGDYLADVKYLMKRLGLDCGRARAPFPIRTGAEERGLAQVLATLPGRAGAGGRKT